MRLALLVLVALVVTVVASPGNGSQGQPASAQTPPDQAEVTLVGPQRVVVRDLSAVPTVLPQGKEVRVIPRLTPDIEARASSGGATQAAEANVLDSAARQGLEAKAPPGISTNFEGLDDNDNVAVTGFTITPPDPQLAVGPNHIAEFVNIVGRITNKSGVPAVSDFSLASFFLVAPGSSDFDPKVIYDDIHDRFFAAYVSIDAFGDGILHLAISETSDPTGAWNLYFASYPGEFPDYPGIGVTNDKFTISYNLFNTSTFLFVGEQTLVVEKADVMAGVGGGSVGVVFFAVNPSRFTVRPAHSLSSVNDQYLTTFDVSFGLPSGALTVIRITGTPNASNVAEASATNVTTLFHDDPPPSVTAGTGDCIVRTINFGPPPCIDSGDFRMLEAIWRDNSLWSSASAECLPPGDTSVRSCAHLIEVETLGTPSVVQDIMFGASGEYFSWPAIRTDAAGNLYVSLTHSDPSTFGEARVAGRCATDPPNTMSGSSVLRAGETVHVTGRWGDYLGAAVDPSDPSAVWLVGEYAKNTGGTNWGTYLAKTSYGACPGAVSASSTASACDYDGDGKDDLAIGVPGEDIGAVVDAGAVNVLYGSGSGLTAAGDQLWHQNVPGVMSGAEAGDIFGESLACGDFNGDGFDDLAVGVPGEDIGAVVDGGAVNVFYGSASGLTASGDQLWHQNVPGVLGGAEAGDLFGSSLASGDYDGNGRDDLAVGAPGEDVGALVDAGAVNVLYGSGSRLTASGDQLWHQNVPGVLGGAEAGDLFGSSLASGDYDGNGRDDLAVGAPGEDVGAVVDAGAVNVLYGSGSRLTASGDQLWHQNVPGVLGGAEAGDLFGSSLASGDYDGNGRDDLAVGAPGEDVGAVVDAGAVNVLYGSGSRLTASGDQLWHQNVPGVLGGAEAGDLFGSSLASGNYDGSGKDDLAIGAPREDVGALVDAGAVNVLYGSGSRLTASGDQLWHQNVPGVLGGAEAGDLFGSSLASGDYDGKGKDDLAIGAPGEDVGAVVDAGAVNVLYGSGSRLTASGDQLWHQNVAGVLGGAEAGDLFGS